jgi:REP element-mobilizing transposase RayT
MLEHFHLLIKPEPADTTPLVLKALKEESAKRLIRTLRQNVQHAWCRKMLTRLRLTPTVHALATRRL